MTIKTAALKTESFIASIEQVLVVAGLSMMIILGALQVLLRNFFNTGIDWADLFVRALVLWLGFIGASLATRRRRHISIDAVSKFIRNKKLESLRQRTVDFVSLLLCVILFRASVEFTLVEMQGGMKTFWGLPTWTVFLVVPVCLFLISVRILISFFIGERIEDVQV